MNCSFCNNEPVVICFCSKLPLCAMHLGPHILSKGKHPYESLNCFLQDVKIPIFKSSILKNIELTIEVQNNITKQTGEFIRKIENLQNLCMENLNEKIDYLMDLLRRTKFCHREIIVAKQICEEELVVVELEDIEVSQGVREFYEQLFLIERKTWTENEAAKHKEDIVEEIVGLKSVSFDSKEESGGNNNPRGEKNYRRGGSSRRNRNSRMRGQNNFYNQRENKSVWGKLGKLGQPSWWTQ